MISRKDVLTKADFFLYVFRCTLNLKISYFRVFHFLNWVFSKIWRKIAEKIKNLGKNCWKISQKWDLVPKNLVFLSFWTFWQKKPCCAMMLVNLRCDYPSQDQPFNFNPVLKDLFSSITSWVHISFFYWVDLKLNWELQIIHFHLMAK